jgi:predicted amidophosphoribosyltransferase
VVQWGVDTTPVPFSWWKSVVRNFHRREAVVRSFALRTQRRLDALRRVNGINEA